MLVYRGDRPQTTPFGVGETLEYGGTYRLLVAPIGMGKVATLSVVAIDTIDGVAAWKFSFLTDISIPFYHNHSALTSWTTVGTFVSRRFDRRVEETGYARHDDFGIFADSGFYRVAGDTASHRTPREPLDDVAFFYYIRLSTTPLEVGKTYRIDRYFRDDRNPAVISVLRREPCDLPQGVKARCLVLNPVVDDPPHGMFMKSNNAELWVTDDSRRIPVRIKSGAYTLDIRKITLAR